ncbi:MAG: molybdopterin cofactor-binding domain-containing protein [[Clostridium] scindens]
MCSKEPLCAYLSQVTGGHLVALDVGRGRDLGLQPGKCMPSKSRLYPSCQVGRDIRGQPWKLEAFSNQGAYASHGHSVVAKGMGAFPQLYPCPNVDADSYTVFTNRPVAGAMRGYGIPQAMFAVESHTDDVAKAIGMSPLEFRRKNLMPKILWMDSLRTRIMRTPQPHG